MVTPQRIVLLIGLLVPTAQPRAYAQSPQINTTFGSDHSGVAFTQNLGQVADVGGRLHPEILYTTSFAGVDIFVSAGRISYVYSKVEGDMEAWDRCDHNPDNFDGPIPTVERYRMDLELLGSNLNARAVPSDQIPGYNNYYLAHCPDGVLNVGTYRTVVLKDIYSKVDMVLRGGDRGMKCDFVIHPGGRPSDIRMRYLGGDAPQLIGHGELRVENPIGFIQEEAPYTFQPTLPMFGSGFTDGSIQSFGGTDAKVASRWVIGSGGLVGFNLGEYDPTRPLIIDPTRKWATYYGGTGSDQMFGSDVTEVDRAGNVYITGSTSSGAFPVSIGPVFAGTTDLYVVKMASNGTRTWAMVLGGTADDHSHGISTDAALNVYITGHTGSANFPLLNPHQSMFGGGGRDALVARFDSNGVRQWSTYYGGSGLDDAYGFAIDSSGNPAFVGVTESSTGIAGGTGQDLTYNGGYDFFLVRFNGSGVRQWATYFGDTGNDCGWAVATDKYDNITIAGWTNSDNFPTLNAFQGSRNGGYDACVAQFSRAGKLLWSTYYGGNENEGGDIPIVVYTGYLSLATDGAANVILAGRTSSTDFPLSNPTIQNTYGGGANDAFIVKFDSVGARQWATYQGGDGEDRISGVATTNSSNVVVTGATGSIDFPGITDDAFQTTKQGGTGSLDAFMMKINADGSVRIYGTFYGGIGSADEGFGISTDSDGSIVVGGETSSNNLPVTAGAYQGLYGGNTDVFIVSFEDIESSTVESRPTSLANRIGISTLGSIRPNPVVGTAEVEYEVVEDGLTQLYLVDLLGRVTPVVHAELKAGRYVATFDVSILSSGLYVCVLQTATERLSTVMRVET